MWKLTSVTVCCMVVPAMSSASGPREYYRVAPIGWLDHYHPGSQLRGLNQAGQASGDCADSTGYLHAVLWDPMLGLRDLGDLPGGSNQSEGFAINNVGHVAGYSQNAWGNGAFLWTPELGLHDLGELPGGAFFAEGFGINDLDQVVGWSQSNNGPNGTTSYEAFVWDAQNGMIGLGDLPGSQFYSKAFDINNSGEVTGVSRSEQRGLEAFIWNPTFGMRDLGALPGGGYAVVAYAINDLDQITGFAATSRGSQPFLWSPATGLEIIAYWPGPHPTAVGLGINDLGQIVGYGFPDSATPEVAFVWDRSHGLRNLDSLVDAVSLRRFGHIYTAVSINNSGQIGANILGQGAVLTPFVLADMNCDGSVNQLDIAGFVLALRKDWPAYHAAYPDCHGDWAADANQDGSINQFDIQDFVASLGG